MIKNISRKQIALLFGDIILIAFSIYLAPVLRFQMVLDPFTILSSYDVLTILVYILVFYAIDLYDVDEIIDKLRLSFEFVLAILIVNIINSAIFYLFHLRSSSSWMIFFSGLLALFFLVFWRLVFIYATNKLRTPIRILILGAGPSGIAMYGALKANDYYKVVGFADEQAKQGFLIDDMQILGSCDNLSDLIKRYKVSKIIVAMKDEIKNAIFDDLVHAKFSGVAIYEMPTFYEKVTGKIPVFHTSNRWIGYADVCGIKKNAYNSRIKIILDKINALIFLSLTFPLMLLIAVAIKLDSPGPVFCIQRRTGLQEKSFKMVKFRSMYVGSEKNREFAYQKKDLRITRLGEIIRYFRFDEIPQLWNILLGEMSFVGPRALMVEEVTDFTQKIPYFSLRHSIRPGLTGWAQINYRHGVKVEDALAKLEYDLYYLKNESFLLDVRIMLKTVRVVLLGIGVSCGESIGKNIYINKTLRNKESGL